VTLEGAEQDISRLVTGLPGDLHPVEGDPRRAVLTLIDPEGGATGDAANEAARGAINGIMARLNGVGKLRWGRSFSGIDSVGNRRYRTDGSEEQVVFAGVAKAYLTFEEFQRFTASQGFPPPATPDGLADINGLFLPDVVALGETDAVAARILGLVNLALSGDHDIDWVLAYVVLETVRADAKARGADGRALGWWTRRDERNFRATANSHLALGVRARHGWTPNAVPAPMMSDTDASWFLRQIVARWSIWRLNAAHISPN
jgi:hypothetical protein